jgi:hypothetical protein
VRLAAPGDESEAAVKIQGLRDLTVFVEGDELEIGPSLRLWNHSPTGFNWGYGGSGPAQLALALLLAAGVRPEDASDLHQRFKWEVIAPLPQGEPFVLDFDVAGWARTALANRVRR